LPSHKNEKDEIHSSIFSVNEHNAQRGKLFSFRFSQWQRVPKRKLVINFAHAYIVQLFILPDVMNTWKDGVIKKCQGSMGKAILAVSVYF
jgi:hypothetical protein